MVDEVKILKKQKNPLIWTKIKENDVLKKKILLRLGLRSSDSKN